MTRVIFSYHSRHSIDPRLPHAKKLIHIERDEKTAMVAKDLNNAGYAFGAEMLPNGMISLTAEYKGERVVQKVSGNDLGLPNKVDALIELALRHWEDLNPRRKHQHH